MIKVIILWIFYMFLLVPAFSNNETQVSIQLLPFTAAVTLPLSMIVLGFTTAGVLVTTLIGMIDRAQLQSKQRKTQRELEQLRTEVTSLRELATLERQPE